MIFEGASLFGCGHLGEEQEGVGQLGGGLLEDVADVVDLDDGRLGLVAAGVEGVRVGGVGALESGFRTL